MKKNEAGTIEIKFADENTPTRSELVTELYLNHIREVLAEHPPAKQRAILTQLKEALQH